MTAEVRPENCGMRRLIDLDAEIEKPRAIAAITVQQHNRRRAFSPLHQPATRLTPVERGPTLVRDFDCATTDARERLRRHDIRPSCRTRNPVHDERKRP